MGSPTTALWQGISAYVLWGLFPLYWPLLEPAGTVELLAHRTVWSLLAMIVLLSVWRNRSWLRLPRPAVLFRTSAAALMLSFNWGVYVYGVNSGRVVEASLGYFMAPLVLIATGVRVFGEVLRPRQWVAVCLGVGAVPVLATAYGHVPWIAIALAGSWAAYGYLKKTVDLSAAHATTVETAAMAVPAAGYLLWLASRGDGTFAVGGPGHSLLLASTGLAVVPLLLFAAAAREVPLSMLGVLQYVEPTVQFAIGVAVRHEPMPVSRWAGFGLVWSALVLLAYDARRATREQRGDTPVFAVETAVGGGRD